MKINNNLKVAPSPNKSVKTSPARTPTKSIKSHKPIAESTPINTATDKNQNIQQPKTKEISDTKSFITFTENLDESLNENAFEKIKVLEEEHEEEVAETNKLEGIEFVI